MIAMSDIKKNSGILKVGGMPEMVKSNPKVNFKPTESSVRRMAKANQEEHIRASDNIMKFKITR